MFENQEFGKGDIAMLEDFRVKVIECIYDDDTGEWFYEVECVDFDPLFARKHHREVPQSALKAI